MAVADRAATTIAAAATRSCRQERGLFPPPLRGRVSEGGHTVGEARAPTAPPTLRHSPQGGGESPELVPRPCSLPPPPPSPRCRRRRGRSDRDDPRPPHRPAEL